MAPTKPASRKAATTVVVEEPVQLTEVEVGCYHPGREGLEC